QLGLKALAIHENRDVTFGGRAPYTGPESLAELSRLVLRNKLNVGLACDCDGDRFGVVDEKGQWVSPNEVLALVAGHLIKNRGMQGRVCKNVVTSHLVNLVAKTYGREVRETPVGFRHIGELMRTGSYFMGGEESGGLTIRGHVPDKDGILACLLVAELLAFEKKPLSVLRANLKKQFGEFYSQKISVPLGDFNFTAVSERLSVKPPLDLAGFSVWRIDQTDGFKFILKDGSWLGLRHSGVERLVRLYAEATDAKKLKALVEKGKKIIRGDF
ncbi:MAG: phosphoglucomutase/phosphomannomutase family protein, partial [Elusimicrobia bacterium]|nr:phosphoglucomutase/phosphomannomutase family protein [Elusimicrobiota bacterium]